MKKFIIPQSVGQHPLQQQAALVVSSVLCILLNQFGSVFDPANPENLSHLSEIDFLKTSASIKTMYCNPAPLPPPLSGPLPPWEMSLPFINSQGYVTAISSFTCTIPMKSSLVIWGPKSTGKSIGISFVLLISI